MIARDELTDTDLALSLFEQALEDDPTSISVADDLGQLLSNLNDFEELVGFYYRRLEHVRVTEPREGERLRLWDRLASLCMALDRTDDALAAYEVGAAIVPDDVPRRIRLAELYTQTNNLPQAIVQHQAILRLEKRRV